MTNRGTMYRFETERQQHIAEHGSFLYCPEHDTLCSFMEKTWETGCRCSRKPCIVEDPEYIALRKRQEETAAQREAAERRYRAEEMDAAPIRTQNKSWEVLQREKIHRLEEESRQAYRRNWPRIGEAKLHEAILLRRELRRRTGKDEDDV